MINVTTVNTELGELFGVQFEESSHLLPVLHATRDSAELAMVEYAQSRIATIDANYALKEGATRPGKRSNADKNEMAAMVAVVDSFSEVLKEREIIANYKASLSPEKLALLEG